MEATMRRATIVYDGSCNLCRRGLRWIYRFDWFKKFDALPYQSDQLHERFPQLNRADCERVIHVVFSDERVYVGGDALRKIYLCMPATFIVGVIMTIPPLPSVVRKIYSWIASRRQCFGKKCYLENLK
jgi:predicted DCC family thiol-disulfide oxidoreductase YuxK